MAGQFSVGVLFYLLDKVSGPMKGMAAKMKEAMKAPTTGLTAYSQKLEALGKSFYRQGRLGQRMAKELTMSVTVPMLMVGVGAFKAAAELERLEFGLLAVSRNAKVAKDAMMEMRTFQKSHKMFSTEDLGVSTKHLLRAGVGVKDLQGSLGMLGEISAAIGKPMEKLAETFADAKKKGSVGGLISMLEDEGIPITEKLANRFGVAKRDLGTLASIGVLGFKDVNAELQKMTSKGGEYFGWMDRRAKSLDGQLERLMSALKGVGKGFSEGVDIAGIIGHVAGAVEKLANAMTNFTKTYPTLSKWAYGLLLVLSLVGPLGWAFGKTLKILGGFISGVGKLITLVNVLYKTFLILKAILWALAPAVWASLGPFILIAAAVAAVAGAAYLLWRNLDAISDWFNSKGKWLQEFLLIMMEAALPGGIGIAASTGIRARMAERAPTAAKEKVEVNVNVKAEEGTEATVGGTKKTGNPNVKVKTESALGAMMLKFGIMGLTP